MSEGSSRSSQEGLDGLHGDGRQPATLQRTQMAPGTAECRRHPPVTRVCASSPHTQTRRLQLNTTNPSVTSHLNSTQGLHRAGGHGLSPTSIPQGGANTVDGGPALLSDGHCPPPYNAHHRLAGSQSSPQLATAQRPPLQHARLSPLLSAVYTHKSPCEAPSENPRASKRSFLMDEPLSVVASWFTLSPLLCRVQSCDSEKILSAVSLWHIIIAGHLALVFARCPVIPQRIHLLAFQTGHGAKRKQGLLPC
ncbi:hypothetical protein GBF38_008977 [Nibea albiflora]|uniref:Uncharacterized protein n=1 Tax=Nibea albiflora TaxID=240163 RepID=A0ACB7ERS1_NIBAL|nr:hypothetical protein GBF38_008977 [Nibea albiflora]